MSHNQTLSTAVGYFYDNEIVCADNEKVTIDDDLDLIHCLSIVTSLDQRTDSAVCPALAAWSRARLHHPGKSRCVSLAGSWPPCHLLRCPQLAAVIRNNDDTSQLGLFVL